MFLKNRFIVVMPVWNAQDLIEGAIVSMLQQDFDDCGIIIRNDASDDLTTERISRLIGIDGVNETRTTSWGKDIIYIKNKTKLYGGGNTYDSVINYVSNPESIIGVVDGDDKLIDARALEKIYNIYMSKRSLLVWSQHQAKSLLPINRTGYSNPLPPDHIIYTSRNYWSVSHFRTCKAWLFHQIDAGDLMDPFIKDSFCQYAGDAAFLYPIIELCGNDRSHFLDEVLYLYNDDLPGNDKTKAVDQVSKYSDYIRTKQNRYQRLGALIE